MDNLWFEDELEPPMDAIEAHIKSRREKDITAEKLQELARGIVRADQPRWSRLRQAPLTAGSPGTLWVVRLRFQFGPLAESSRFALARCEAYLEPLGSDEPVPTVYDFYPQDLYEGEPQTVSLKFGPTLKVAGFDVSPGEIRTDVTVGQIAPVVVGWPGPEERAPYWELRPKKHSLEGTRALWLVLEQPEGCRGIRLRARVEGIIQTYWGPIAVYPKERVWDNRPNVVIQ